MCTISKLSLYMTECGIQETSTINVYLRRSSIEVSGIYFWIGIYRITLYNSTEPGEMSCYSLPDNGIRWHSAPVDSP